MDDITNILSSRGPQGYSNPLSKWQGRDMHSGNGCAIIGHTVVDPMLTLPVTRTGRVGEVLVISGSLDKTTDKDLKLRRKTYCWKEHRNTQSR